MLTLVVLADFLNRPRHCSIKIHENRVVPLGDNRTGAAFLGLLFNARLDLGKRSILKIRVGIAFLEY